MKNRLLAIFIALFAATLFAFGAVACDSSESTTDSEPSESISASVTESTSGLESGNEGESSFESNSESSSSGEIEHTHDFCVKNVDAKYLKSAATCTQKAIYYYSCACGETGSTTFDFGEFAEHIYAEEWTYNETHHWQNATCEHNIIRNYAQHTLDVSGCCSECGYIPSTEGIVYKVSDDLTYAVVKEYNGSSKTIRIADTYLGLPVTLIGSTNNGLEGYGEAFKGKNIVSVIIPDSVTLIGNYAFNGCSSLTSISIPNSVTSIGDSAFSDCIKLVEVINKSSLNITKGSSDNGYVVHSALYVHNGTSKIDNKNGYQFITYNNVNYLLGYIGTETEIVLPQSYNGQNYEIYNYAFYKNNKITSVTIPNGVTSIGDMSFFNCSKLTSVTIPDSVTSIGDGAFYNCGRLTSVTIGNGVTEIDGSAFEYCSSLTSITIPNSVTSIGDCAFEYCSSLTSVTIPDSVTLIGSDAFYGCISLTSIVFEDKTTWYKTLSRLDWENKTNGAYTDVTNSSTNAKFMVKGRYYWYKV